MAKRFYISDAWPWWSIPDQEALLPDARLPGAAVFRDELGRRDRRKDDPALLVGRAKMLRPTRRSSGEEVMVASPAVVAIDEADLEAVLAALDARGDWLAWRDGTLGTVREAWKLARVLSREKGAGRTGGQITKARIEPIFKAKVEAIRSRWGDPAWTARELCAEAGVSLNTANKHLGQTWNTALVKNRARLRRQAKKEIRA